MAWPKKFILVNNEMLIVKSVWSVFQLLLHWSATREIQKMLILKKIWSPSMPFESLVEHFKYDEAINIPLDKDIFGEEISVQL